jgi:hypothetical protein
MCGERNLSGAGDGDSADDIKAQTGSRAMEVVRDLELADVVGVEANNKIRRRGDIRRQRRRTAQRASKRGADEARKRTTAKARQGCEQTREEGTQRGL